jgi:hypothetical protein
MKTSSRHLADVLTTAVAPAIWGSTYFVTTSFLPQGYPLTVAMLRALPAGLLLLLIVRKLPTGIWWRRAFLLGALNFSFFWAMLFVSAYRLPGGVAATVGAVQPLIVIAPSEGSATNSPAPARREAPARPVAAPAAPSSEKGEVEAIVATPRLYNPDGSLSETCDGYSSGGTCYPSYQDAATACGGYLIRGNCYPSEEAARAAGEGE